MNKLLLVLCITFFVLMCLLFNTMSKHAYYVENGNVLSVTIKKPEFDIVYPEEVYPPICMSGRGRVIRSPF